jgi:hypothetical protein
LICPGKVWERFVTSYFDFGACVVVIWGEGNLYRAGFSRISCTSGCSDRSLHNNLWSAPSKHISLHQMSTEVSGLSS